MARNKRKVLFLPDWRQSNPYQTMLAQAVAEQGYAVDFADYPKARLALFRLLLARRDVGLVHLHWITPWIESHFWSANPVKRWVKLLILLLDVRLCRLLGVKVFWTVHNLVSHESEDSLWEKRIRRGLARQATACFVHSNGALPLLEHEYNTRLADKTTVVPHASYVGRYPVSGPGEIARLRKTLGISDRGLGNRDFVYLFVGIIRKYKGIDDLVTAFRSIPDSDAKLVIAGSVIAPDLRDWLNAEAAQDPRIIFREGYIPDEELPVFLALADAVVLPYAQTLTSGAALLAMSYAKPLVLPETARVYDVPGDAGAVYFDPGRLPAALSAIRKADLAAMGAFNISEARTRSWANMGAITEAAYARHG
ncbi:glycosyltransferase [Pelagibius litoralis]|uniref:Glycosyltransferase n=1 Tax=Pelagibius litoralis TaxID=374515 RepID=A0A967C4Y6_9PROT|nr:glycosyltransferase [Pelagibius litoralis]NIA68520.1 glycosyltransferase [Pelagibius litoralis]